MPTARTLARLERLDREVEALAAKLNTKLDERRTLLATLIANGETVRQGIDAKVRTMTHAANIAATGRALTDDQVREIRRLHKEGVSQTELGRRYGIAQPSIFKIVKRQSYQDVA